MKKIVSAFHNQKLVMVEGRKFMVSPINDHYPETDFPLMEEMVNELSKLTDFTRATKIVGEEDRGGYIAALLAYNHKKPLAVGLEGEIGIDFRNAYTTGQMFLHGAKSGDEVIIVEDMVDSGGTIISMIKLLEKSNIKILDIVVIGEKEEFNGIERIRQETGYTVKHLVKFTCTGETSQVTKINDQLAYAA
jgi:adenine phosphoribosyltransferase